MYFAKHMQSSSPKQSRCFSTSWDTKATHWNDKFVTKTKDMAEKLKVPQSTNLQPRKHRSLRRIRYTESLQSIFILVNCYIKRMLPQLMTIFIITVIILAFSIMHDTWHYVAPFKLKISKYLLANVICSHSTCEVDFSF